MTGDLWAPSDAGTLHLDSGRGWAACNCTIAVDRRNRRTGRTCKTCSTFAPLPHPRPVLVVHLPDELAISTR